MRRGSMQGFAHHPGRLLHRWGTVRLRMTLWNVAVLALILGALGGVVRYKAQADLFATVDRTLAERAHAERPLAEQAPVILTSRSTLRSRLLDPQTVPAERSLARSIRA